MEIEKIIELKTKAERQIENIIHQLAVNIGYNKCLVKLDYDFVEFNTESGEYNGADPVVKISVEIK